MMFHVAKRLLPALWWTCLIIWKKVTCEACISHSFHLRHGSTGNFSTPDYPNITQTKFNYTWIISVPESHHVHLTMHIPAFLPQDGPCWMAIRDGMSPSSRDIGYFGSANFFPAKPWSVVSSGKNLWVNINTCRFNNGPIICHLSFKAVKANETRCRAGWIQYGNDCLLLSSEIIPGLTSLADPNESCTRLQAKTFRAEKIFCHLKFFVYQSAAFIKFQLRNIFNWDRREPLENCTSLENKYKNGITYSLCQRRIYFVCVQGEASISKQVSPAVSRVYAACSSFEVIWELPPVQVVCSRNFHYVMEINSSELNSPIKNELPTESCSFRWGLERNKTYSVRLTAFSLSGMAVGSPWRQEVTIASSAAPDPPEIIKAILHTKSNMAIILWTNSDDHGCYIMYNNIYYRIINERNREPWSKSTFQPYFMHRVQRYLLQVQSDKMYEVIVTAINSEGESSKELINTAIIGNVTKEPDQPALNKTSLGSHSEDSTIPDSKSSFSPALLISLLVLASIIVVTVFTVYIIKKRRVLSFSASFRRKRKDACLVDHWEILPDEIMCIEKIGHGQFGEVHIAEMKSRDTPQKGKLRSKDQWKDKLQGTKITVAVKMLCDEANDEQKKEFLKEIQLMKEVGVHRNIVNMLGCCTRVEPMYLVVEYVSHGDLLNYLRKRRDQFLQGMNSSNSTLEVVQNKANCSHYCDNLGSEGTPSQEETKKQLSSKARFKCPQQGSGMKKDTIEMKHGQLRSYSNEVNDASYSAKEDDDKGFVLTDLLSFSWQIAKGMEYLSSRNFVHRDLAARNILVGDNKEVKVADFGLSRHVHEENVYHCSKQRKLPVKWMAPEAIYDQIFTSQSDVWAYGILLWEMVTFGGSPYPTVTNAQLYKLLKQGYRMEKPSFCSDEMYQIMKACWNERASERPTFEQLRQTLELMLQKDVPYLELSQINKESMNYYTILDVNNHAGFADK